MKKGFTLIELMAIIVLLAVVMAMMVPTIIGVIESSKKDAFASDVKSIIREINNELASGTYYDITQLNVDDLKNIFQIDTKNIYFISTEEVEGEISYKVIGTNEWEGYLAQGTYENIEILEATTPPTIALYGASTVIMEVGQSYVEAGATAQDSLGFSLDSRIMINGAVNSAVAGTYVLTYNVEDYFGNTASVTRTISVMATAIPTVAFGTNGNVTYTKTASTTVTVSDNVALNTDSLEYQWTTSTTAPTEASFTTSFTNGSTVNSPTGLNGGYYLWILGKDVLGNSVITRSNVFNFDNVAPVITTILSGSMIYTDPTFASGTNSTTVYNNSANGTVTITRVPISDYANGSGYGLEIKTTGTASPGWGGFYFATGTAAYKVYISRIIAKIPVGYSMAWASNSYGTDGTVEYLTSMAGTGQYEEYIFKVNCGSTGTFSSTNFYYLNGSPTPTSAAPLVWTVAYATVYDATIKSSNNAITIKATDSANGIVAYGVNSSSTVEPTYTSVTSTPIFTKSAINSSTYGIYFVWVKDSAGNVTKQAAISGSMLFTDATFKGGVNSMAVYNNSANGTVTHSRISMSTPTGSGYAVQISNTGTASPGIGGYVQSTTSAASKVYYHRIIAKIPVGYSIAQANNSVGTDSYFTWLTSREGTGEWEEYIYSLTTGATGTFSTFGHVYLNGTAGTPTAPVIWYVAYSTMFN